MKASELPVNKYGNVTCYDQKTMDVTLPEGFVKTALTITQLKKLQIDHTKGIIGFEFRSIGGRFGTKISMPKLINLVAIDDYPKALKYEQMMHIKKTYGMDESDWLFK